MLLGDLMSADPRVTELLGLVGISYWWGKGDPSTPFPASAYDCSGLAQGVLVKYGMLKSTEPDRNAYNLAMISDPVTRGQQKFGDLAFYGRNGKITHVQVCIGGPWTIGARGGGSKTKGNDPKAFVDLKKIDYRSDLVVVGRIKTEYQ